jgi:hypothetical protein
MADLKYYEIQIETYRDGKKDSKSFLPQADAKEAEKTFNTKMGQGISNPTVKTALNLAFDSKGTSLPDCNEFYKNLPEGEAEVVKYYLIRIDTYVEPVEGKEEELILSEYASYNEAWGSYRSRKGSLIGKENIATSLLKLINSHGGEEKLSFIDNTEPEPPEPSI